MILKNTTKNIVVVTALKRADTFTTRLFGLIPRSGLHSDEGLWLEPCAMIHTCFMRFDIDAVFVSADLRVLKIYPALKPWRFSAWVRDARSVIELPSGKAAGILTEGDNLEVSV